MKKYKFLIKELVPVSENTPGKILAKFEFYASSSEEAEHIREIFKKAYHDSPAYKTSPRTDDMLVDEELITE